MMGITFTVAGPSDHESVFALLCGQFQELEIEMPAERLRAAVDGVFGDASRGVFLLARAEGEPVGLAYLSYQWTLEHGGPIAWLEELYVSPGARTRGLGAKLLQAALDHVKARGCKAVDLEVEEAHPRAANLYRRHGFRELRRMRFAKALGAVVLALVAPWAAAGEIELSGYVGRGLPTYAQSFDYRPTLSGVSIPGVTIRQQGSFDLDAKGGTAFALGAAYFFAGPLGIEARWDSASFDVALSDVRFEVTATGPPFGSLSSGVALPGGTVQIDDVRPLSLNLKLRSKGIVRVHFSAGLSYLPDFSARIDQPLGLGATSISGGQLQISALGVRADTQAVEGGTQGRLGANAGLGLGFGLSDHAAVFAEGRAFIFKERRVVWSQNDPPRTPLEAQLLESALAELPEVDFTPATWQVLGGVSLSF